MHAKAAGIGQEEQKADVIIMWLRIWSEAAIRRTATSMLKENGEKGKRNEQKREGTV